MFTYKQNVELLIALLKPLLTKRVFPNKKRNGRMFTYKQNVELLIALLKPLLTKRVFPRGSFEFSRLFTFSTHVAN